MVPEGADEFIEGAVGGADADVVADHVVGGDADDAPGDGVFAPGGEGVLVELLDAGGVVVVGAGGEGGPAGGVVDGGGNGA